MATTPSEAPAAAEPRRRVRAPTARAPGPRHHARALALQGLYAWLLAGGNAADIACQLLDEEQRGKVDTLFFEQLLTDTIAAAPLLRADFAGLLDRPVAALSPVEHALLLLGTYELRFRPEIPVRVSINEAVELAKSYGGTDGFRYINGVLDKLAARLRTGAAAAQDTAAPWRLVATGATAAGATAGDHGVEQPT